MPGERWEGGRYRSRLRNWKAELVRLEDLNKRHPYSAHFKGREGWISVCKAAITSLESALGAEHKGE